MERGAGSGVSERDAVLQTPAARRRVKIEPGLEEEPTREHFRMVQDSTYVPTGVCSPQASCAVKQEMDIGPTVLQPTDLPYIKLEFDVPIKEEPFQMVQDSTYVPAGVCSPQASCAVKQEISVEPTVLQPTDLPFIKLESIKKEPLQVEIKSSVSMNDETAISSNNMMKGRCVSVPKLQVKKKQPSEVCSKLKSHNEIHTGVHTFQCDVCLKSFRQKGNLNVHVLAMHTDIRPFKCDICLKTFTQNITLKNHMMIHTDVRAFKCDVCFKSFRLKGHLNSHMAIHNGVRVFKCDVCLKSFRLKGNLNSHMAIHTGIRPFKCNLLDIVHTKKIFK